eukprot:TRINITY_DN590_c0_g1_i1.p2 TRINITY_DN590_c0_g1~~TRINITY_DN590_c0_g1_i1.p2  ORF type:complete len:252 (-),score=91.23 TRINITY_DN590_c0_g1_i1:65-820(-)
MFSDSDDDTPLFSEEDVSLFTVPRSYFPPEPEPTFAKFSPYEGCELNLRLVGKHSLWGHLIWNASKVMCEILTQTPLKGKKTLELGAGGALPSLVAALQGASRVVVTDYPDKPLIENIQYNVDTNIPAEILPNIQVAGYIWGKELEFLQSADEKFDYILLSDLVFNHSQHQSLIKTCVDCLTQDGKIFVSFTHHRPQFVKEDLQFFDVAAAEPFSLKVEKLFEKNTGPMFEEDEETRLIRSFVHFYVITRK